MGPIILAAPNVSARMGGEAMKALEICLELTRLGFDVHQITHERVRAELETDHPGLNVTYIADSRFQVLLDKLGFDWLLVALNLWQINRLARKLAAELEPLVVHATAPISPVLPHFAVPDHPYIIGPLNGNIYHPPGFAGREPWLERASHSLLGILQPLLGRLFPGKRDADAILVAGGERTVNSLLQAGCRPEQFVTSLDSGIPTALVQRPRITHQGSNNRFVFVGRLVALKGCDLAIRAVAAAPERLELDIIGEGPERASLLHLADELGVAGQINLLGWKAAGDELYDQLAHYRGFVFPSLADANGIVVQEAMTIGLPVICLNWGGPAMLVDASYGVLIEPIDEGHVVRELARAMSDLSRDGELAETMSRRARAAAIEAGYDWTSLLESWSALYREIALTKVIPDVPAARRAAPRERDATGGTGRRLSRISQEAALCWTLWRKSAKIGESEHPPTFRQRVQFVLKCLVNRQEIAPLLSPVAGSSLAMLLAERPQMVGIVLWPYICSSWPVAQRIAQLVGHCEIIDRLGPPLRRHPGETIELLDLTHVHPGAKLVLDQPQWFMREGQVVLNLFVDGERMFSLAFDFRQGPLGLEAVVGAVQGRDLVHARECYKELTKSFFGMRPRDLLFELFRAFCRTTGVSRIFAVSDQFRHHRSAYFGRKKSTDLSLDYDEVWTDRDGRMINPAFFEFSPELPLRDNVPARKRAMYKRRYAFLDEAEAGLRRWLHQAGEPGVETRTVAEA